MKNALVYLGLALAASSLCAKDVGVRIRFGLNDRAPQKWDGTVSVAPGRVTLISGWRFEQTDAAQGVTGWTASTHFMQQDRRTNNPKKAAPRGKNGAVAPMADNGILLSLTDATEDTVVQIKTAQGNFDVKLSEIPYGVVVEKLNRAVEVERTASAQQFTDQNTDDDFPAAAIGADGTQYVAYVSYTLGIDRNERAKAWEAAPADLAFLAKVPGGDQLWVRAGKDGQWSAPLAVTSGGGDIYKTSVAVDGGGQLWIVWAENKNWKGKEAPNFEIWARSLKNGALSEPINLSNHAESDVNPVAAADAQGRVWVAWQGARKQTFAILERHQLDGGKWSDASVVSTQTRNCWTPAIAATAKAGGKVAIAWDTYDMGDYDVWVREFDAQGKPGVAQPVANSEDYEARPAMTYDAEGSLWIAWEQSGPTWGKDWGAYARDKGIGLYRDRQIGLAILKNGSWFEPAAGFVDSLPGAFLRRRINNLRVPPVEAGGESRKAGEEAEARRNLPHNNLARIVADHDGRIWLFTRSRQNDFPKNNIGSLWLNYAACYDGAKWSGPILLPHSDNLLYNSPAVVPMPAGGLFIAHSSDHRQDRHVLRGKGEGSFRAGNDPFDNDIYVSVLASAGPAQALALKPAKNSPNAQRALAKGTAAELAAVEASRRYVMKTGDKKLQILRGEFHRHTEISGDGGGDGPLEDMWRYALDVAEMDWLGCGDHDNGDGREYSWWLTQKTTDAFLVPGHFTPMFSYERSVSYPEGHRNVVFVQRGVRTLPRLPISDRNQNIHAPDTQMLYKYLHLFDGVCASHTSATSMGTDWRDSDPVVEPMVEIYQGCRQNYERPGAPRCPTPDDSIGGWEPKGFVNLAFLKGVKFSFEASSDHGSTHISYAMVLAEEPTRAGIHAAMKKRHTYGATDNIIADYRCTVGGTEYIMGDEFTAKEAPTLRLKLIGTTPLAKVTLIKDDVELLVEKPNKTEFETTWTDPKPAAGKTSYYYWRGEQADGEIVWVSPMWITYKP